MSIRVAGNLLRAGLKIKTSRLIEAYELKSKGIFTQEKETPVPRVKGRHEISKVRQIAKAEGEGSASASASWIAVHPILGGA